MKSLVRKEIKSFSKKLKIEMDRCISTGSPSEEYEAAVIEQISSKFNVWGANLIQKINDIDKKSNG